MSIVLAVVKDKERFVILAHDQEPSSLFRFGKEIDTLHQSGTISVYTLPWRLSTPKTIVLP